MSDPTPRPVAPGPRESLETCYRTYAKRVFHWALRYGAGSRPWAEDLTHEVFVRLAEHLPALEGQDLGAWLYRVTANLAISKIRHERSLLSRWTRAIAGGVAEEAPADVGLELREEARAALAALERFPARERVAFAMKLLDGRSQAEIAQALSLSKGYVSKLIARGWERLRLAGWEVPDERD